VGEDHSLDVLGTEAEAAQVLQQALRESGKAGIDRGQATAVLDEIPVDERVGEPVNAGDDVASRCDGGASYSAVASGPRHARVGQPLS
jgi:hypothetical protein